ncbi:MAG: hypothetical protein IKK70_06650 [Clostridia bacterium]|nr:hypothetical protein [Clostridia bacterium]
MFAHIRKTKIAYMASSLFLGFALISSVSVALKYSPFRWTCIIFAASYLLMLTSAVMSIVNAKYTVYFYSLFFHTMSFAALDLTYALIVGQSVQAGAKQPIEAICRIAHWEIMLLSCALLLIVIAYCLSKPALRYLNVGNRKNTSDSSKEAIISVLVLIAVLLSYVIVQRYYNTVSYVFKISFALLAFSVFETLAFAFLRFSKIEESTGQM